MSRAFTKDELEKILADHGKWLRGVTGGVRANLRGANLRGAYLRGANFAYADLTYADLTYADLTYAYLAGADLRGAHLAYAHLTGADLTDAHLTGADLTYAHLTGAKADFLVVLDAAPTEVPALLAALREGRVDGSTYEGDCACLVGTIANARGVSHRDVPNLAPNSQRPAERLFLAIRKGDTPQTNQIAKIVEGWIGEWMTAKAEARAM